MLQKSPELRGDYGSKISGNEDANKLNLIRHAFCLLLKKWLSFANLLEAIFHTD